jgi:hypothetical protein
MLLPLLLALHPAAQAAPEFVFPRRLGASYWGLGLRGTAEPGLRWSLWNRPDSVLFEDTAFEAVFLNQLTPSYYRGGAQLTFSPIAVFDLTARWIGTAYFGTFSSVRATDDPSLAFTDAEAEALDRGTALGHRASLNPTLKAKVGPVIAVLDGDLQRWWLRPGQGESGQPLVGDYYYEPELSVVMGFHDVSLQGSAALLYDLDRDEGDGRWIYLGSLTSYVHTVAADATMLRTGALAVLHTHEGTWKYALLAQAYLDDRYYTRPLPPYVGFQAIYSL